MAGLVAGATDAGTEAGLAPPGPWGVGCTLPAGEALGLGAPGIAGAATTAGRESSGQAGTQSASPARTTHRTSSLDMPLSNPVLSPRLNPKRSHRPRTA